MPDFGRLYIDGKWVPPAEPGLIDVIDPATEEVLASVPNGSPADVDAAVDAARRAFDAWWHTPVAERAALLRSVAHAVKERANELAQQISSEMGSPLWFASAVQVGLPVNSFLHAAETAEEFAFEYEDGNSTILREPIGVVGAITPWNYPLHQIAAKTAYALAAGNTVVVKPSEVSPLDGWLLAEIMDEVGVPPGVFNLVSGTGPVVGQAIAAHPGIDAISFTGSTAAGKLVAKVAADTVKRVALELGGKSPNVILPDADLTALMPAAVNGAMINSGQTCAALTRMIVPRERLAEAEALAVQVVETLTVGDPASSETRLGPLASRAQLERVRAYIDRGIAEGAKLVAGGSDPVAGLDRGFYVRPTVFSEVTREMTIHREEIFGPVLVMVAYDTVEEAVEIANDTEYGLSGSVWSADPELARAVAGRIRTGQVSINGGAFNPNAPFGGYKQSGIGREFGRYGLEEFLETKSLQR